MSFVQRALRCREIELVQTRSSVKNVSFGIYSGRKSLRATGIETPRVLLERMIGMAGKEVFARLPGF